MAVIELGAVVADDSIEAALPLQLDVKDIHLIHVVGQDNEFRVDRVALADLTEKP